MPLRAPRLDWSWACPLRRSRRDSQTSAVSNVVLKFAARTLDRRIIVAFQPHRFSRTAALMSAFGPSLADADHVVLTDIYAAGEDPLPGVTVEALAAAIRGQTRRPV